MSWERGRARILSLWLPLSSRPHPVPLAAAKLQFDAAGSHPVGGNSIGQAEGEPRRGCRLIQVAEMAEAVPGLVRAGRPRSREAFIPWLPNSSHQGHKIAEAFWRRLSLKEVNRSSCQFVFIRGSSQLTIGRFSQNDPHAAGRGPAKHLLRPGIIISQVALLSIVQPVANNPASRYQARRRPLLIIRGAPMPRTEVLETGTWRSRRFSTAKVRTRLRCILLET